MEIRNIYLQHPKHVYFLQEINIKETIEDKEIV
jgi:hypothetical protein